MSTPVKKDIPDMPDWLIENLMTVVAVHPDTKVFYDIEQLYEHIGKRCVDLGIANDERCFFRGTDNPEYERILWYSEHPKRIAIDHSGGDMLVTALHAHYGCLVLFPYLMNKSRRNGYLVLDIPSSQIQMH